MYDMGLDTPVERRDRIAERLGHRIDFPGNGEPRNTRCGRVVRLVPRDRTVAYADASTELLLSELLALPKFFQPLSGGLLLGHDERA